MILFFREMNWFNVGNWHELGLGKRIPDSCILEKLSSPSKSAIKTTHYLAVGSMSIVFIIDIFTPIEFVAGILYLCCILIVFKQNTRTIIGFSVAACLLIAIDMVFFDLRHQPSISNFVNHGVSVIAILITAYMAVQHRKISDAGEYKRQQYINALEHMLVMTSHQVRRPVANILGILEIISNDSFGLSKTEIKDGFGNLRFSANQLDCYIKELSAFIEQSQEKNLAADHGL